MSVVTPRILPKYLQQFHNANHVSAVRLLGKVSSLRGEHATITCGEHGEVTLILNQDSHIQMDRMIDVVGKIVEVDGGLGLRVYGATDCGDPADVDYKVYEYAVDVTHRFKDIFF